MKSFWSVLWLQIRLRILKVSAKKKKNILTMCKGTRCVSPQESTEDQNFIFRVYICHISYTYYSAKQPHHDQNWRHLYLFIENGKKERERK